MLGTALGIVPGAFAYAALGGSLDDPWSLEFMAAAGLAAALAVGGALEARRRGRREPVPSGRDPEGRRLLTAASVLAAGLALFLVVVWVGLFH